MNLKSILLVSALVSAGAANASLIAAWNFNDSTAGTGGALGTIPTATASTGVGTWTTNAMAGTLNSAPSGVGTFGGTTDNAYSADVAGQALAIQAGATSGNMENNGSYVQFNVSTLGMKNVVLSYSTRGTATGFSQQDVSYSLNGTSFTAFQSLTGTNVTTFGTKSLDLSGIAAVNNVSSLTLRIALSGASSQGGNNRFDNVQINGVQAVPEPGALAALGLGALAMVRRRPKA